MKKKNKYIFISSGYRGGATTFLSQHMQYLISKKKNIVLIDDNPKNTFEYLDDKIHKHKINVSNSNNDSKKKISKILNLGKEKKILFITNYAFLIKYFFILKNFRDNGNEIILTIHSGILNLNFKTFIAGVVFSLLYKNLDCLYFGSSSAKNWWSSKYPWMSIDKCPIYYNGVEIVKNIRTKKLKNRINISFIGRLEKEHNPNFFIEIANKYLMKNKNVIFNIFGDGSMLHKLKEKIVSKKIIFHGWVKKREIYKNSDIVIITSPHQNYPYAALEAKSFGIPVISCSTGDISKIVKHNFDGLVKHTDSSTEMINLIDKALNNYNFFSKNSIKRSKKFNINNSCNKFWKNMK